MKRLFFAILSLIFLTRCGVANFHPEEFEPRTYYTTHQERYVINSKGERSVFLLTEPVRIFLSELLIIEDRIGYPKTYKIIRRSGRTFHYENNEKDKGKFYVNENRLYIKRHQDDGLIEIFDQIRKRHKKRVQTYDSI